jgi:polysaccharide pyruvyl transferase WcaK-like protein
VIATTKLPKVMLLHPVGEGSTRMMNVWSAKLWLRALVNLLPDVVIDAAWIPYAEVAIDRERGLRDALTAAESCHGCVAVGGEFSRGMVDEWELFGHMSRPRIDLTRKPMPAILTTESFPETQRPSIRQAIVDAFRPFALRAAA